MVPRTAVALLVAGWLALPAPLRAQPGQAGSQAWRVRVADTRIQPGDVVRVVVTPPFEATAVEGRWGDRRVPFVRESDDTWFTLLGIDVAETPGRRALRVSASSGSDVPVEHDEVLEVAPKAVRTRRLRVNPKFVTPPRRVWPRIEQETALLNELFARTSSDRWWRDGAVRPVEGVAVSGFGVRSILNGRNRGPHNGLDLAAGTGTPVHAPTPGVVVYAREFYYSGNTVILDHGLGLYSTMAHLSAIDVQEGQRVDQGALLGKVGATGRVTGPHLHWAVRLHGARVDPLSLLEVLQPGSSTAPK
jgi:murein DD-endopeptidase MepM/ murein hydrolase activator NlpD